MLSQKATAQTSVTISTKAPVPKYVMTLATLAPADSPWSAILDKYVEAVESKSNGRIDVRLKLGGVLGDEIESMTKCRRGQIQAVGATTGALANQVPALSLVELPYLFRSYDEADSVIDGLLTQAYEPLLRKQGFVLGFWSENGFRQFGTRKHAVHTPADLKGLKMRAQENPVHEAMYKAWGASFTPLPATEVTQALATGNIDGFDQALLYAYAASWVKQVGYITLSDHIYQPALIVFNQEWFDALPADLQGLIVGEGRALQSKGRKAVRQIVADVIEVIKQDNKQVLVLSTAEKQVFERAAAPVYGMFRHKQGPSVSRLLDATQKKLKAMR